MIERYGSRDRRDPSPGNFGPGRGYADPQHWQAHPPRQNSIYPSPAHQNPYDTVPSAEGSYNTEPWGASTDPSSESSSIDRRASGYRTDGNDAVYRDPSSQDLYMLGSSNGKAYQVQQPNGHQNHAQQYAHSIPRTELNHPSGLQKSRLGSQAPFNHSLPETPRVPIKLNGPPAQQSAGADKRRSWLRRTMSRNR